MISKFQHVAVCTVTVNGMCEVTVATLRVKSNYTPSMIPNNDGMIDILISVIRLFLFSRIYAALNTLP